MPDTTPPPTLQPVTTQTVEPPPTAAPVQSPPPSNVPNPSLDIKQAEDTFSALNKLFDEGTPAAAPVSPVVDPQAPTAVPSGPQADAKPPEPTPVGTDLQKQLDAIKAPAGAHPNVAAGIDQVKKLATTAEQRANELQAKLQDYEKRALEAETKIKEAKLPEPVEKELTELRNFQREVNYQNTKEFQDNFVKPLQSDEQEIMGILQQVGVTDETLKFIQENGGVVAVSQSQEKANEKQTLAEWFDQSILGRINTVSRNRAYSKLGHATDVLERGTRELADWRENGAKRAEQRQQAFMEEFQAGEKIAMDAMGDLIKPKTIDATMDAVTRQAAEEHNKRIEEGKVKYQELSKSWSQPKSTGEILVKATQADMMFKLYNDEKAKVADLQSRLDRIKASGATDAGDLTPPAGGVTPPSNSELLKKDTNTALNDLFNQSGITR